MKVYIITEGKPNTGYDFTIAMVCISQNLAENIAKSFPHQNLVVTEYEVIE